MGNEPSGEESIRVIVSKDCVTAEMKIPAGYARQMLTEQTCLGLLQQSGVEVSELVVEAVKKMIAQEPDQDQIAVLAHATPAQHGEDGRVEWLIKDPAEDQGQDQDQNQGDEHDEGHSHYDRSAYTMVNAGDVLGNITAPTVGTDGRDVLGQTIPAKFGKSVGIKIDETVMQDAIGQLIAQVDGVFHRDGSQVCIRQRIEVPSYVDFSTGNIDFAGDVLIKRGVRDCFVVRAAGDVEVNGLVEAATIECKGNFIAHGGMAGRERGRAIVGGNLIAKYLDNIYGEVMGDMEIHCEVINCDLVIHGTVQAANGTIIGGKTIVTGSAELVSLGSGAGVLTEIVLGSVPKLEPIAIQLARLNELLIQKRDAFLQEQKLMSKNTKMMSNSDKERQTELMFGIQNAESKLLQGQTAGEVLKQRIDEQRTVKLVIHRKLFAGAVITVGNQSFKIFSDISGPVTVFMDSRREIVYRKGGSDIGSMTQIAELKAVAA